MMENQNIKVLVMDVDGTLSDGKIYMSPQGECMKAFHIKDGYMIARLTDYHITPVIITGRQSDILLNRCKELHITEVYQGIENKKEKLAEVLHALGCSFHEAAYIGDDLNDLECMELCGMSACPADAAEVVVRKVDFVCNKKGGEGAVREFIEHIIQQNGKDETVCGEVLQG